MVKSIITFSFLVLSCVVFGQDRAVVSTAVPFLTISPDARGGGMAETGVGRQPDINSIYYNAASYACMEHGRSGVSFSYLPWMRHLMEGQNLFSLSGYYKLGHNKKGLNPFVAFGFRYLSGQKFGFTDESENFSPSDYVIEVAYGQKFGGLGTSIGDRFSFGLTLKYIHTGLGELKLPDMEECTSSGAFAFDLSFFYEKRNGGSYPSILSFGVNLSNIGTKIAYMTTGKDAYLPANLRLGGSYKLIISPREQFTVSLDASKLLVRSYDPEKKDESVFESIAGSFGNEKFFKSIVWQLGAEYVWQLGKSGFERDPAIALRTGYFHESELYGYRQYVTFGGGITWKDIELDASYLLPTGEKDAPYKETFKLSLGYTFRK